MAFTLATAVRTAARGAPAGTRGISEKRMFGGVAFFLHGNMVAGTATGDLLLRVGKDGEAAALTKTAALERWLRRALDYVGTLPRKKAKGKRAESGPGGKTKRAQKTK